MLGWKRSGKKKKTLVRTSRQKQVKKKRLHTETKLWGNKKESEEEWLVCVQRSLGKRLDLDLDFCRADIGVGGL